MTESSILKLKIEGIVANEFYAVEEIMKVEHDLKNYEFIGLLICHKDDLSTVTGIRFPVQNISFGSVRAKKESIAQIVRELEPGFVILGTVHLLDCSETYWRDLRILILEK